MTTSEILSLIIKKDPDRKWYSLSRVFDNYPIDEENPWINGMCFNTEVSSDDELIFYIYYNWLPILVTYPNNIRNIFSEIDYSYNISEGTAQDYYFTAMNNILDNIRWTIQRNGLPLTHIYLQWIPIPI